MANQARSEDVKTPLARLAFPDLFKPRRTNADKPNEEPVYKFGCTLLFPKSADISTLKAAVLKAAKEKWGDKAEQWLKDGLVKHPFLDGDGPQGLSKKSGQRHAGYEGHIFIRCSANADRQPRVVDRKVLPLTDPKDAYPGCYVYAVVNAYTWENVKNGKGVSFGISLVQIAKDGERLGGGDVNPEGFFEKIEDEGEAPANTKNGKGAASLFA